MPIVKSEYTTTEHRDGLRARYVCTLTDGHVSEPSPSGGLADEAAVLTKQAEVEAEVIESAQERDAVKTEYEDGDISDSGEASQVQVARQYLRRAMGEEDPLLALRKLEKVQSFFAAEGWTPAQIRTRLNITSRQWTEITTRLSYLKANEQVLIDYKAVLAGDT